MGSWFNHVYLINLYDGLKLIQSEARLKAPIKELVIDGLPLNTEDEALNALYSLVAFDPEKGAASFQSLKSALFQWVLHHSRGPGSYNPMKVDALFDIGPGSFQEIDRLFNHMAKVTLSGVMSQAEILHDPADPALHGGTCYRCHLDVTAFDLPSMYGRRKSIAMGSSLKHLIPLVISEVGAQSDRFNRLQSQGIDSSEYKAESKLKRAKATDIYVELNGVEVVRASIPNKNQGEALDIDWVNASHDSSVSLMRSLSAALPKNIGRQFKARFLENELGM